MHETADRDGAVLAVCLGYIFKGTSGYRKLGIGIGIICAAIAQLEMNVTITGTQRVTERTVGYRNGLNVLVRQLYGIPLRIGELAVLEYQVLAFLSRHITRRTCSSWLFSRQA